VRGRVRAEVNDVEFLSVFWKRHIMAISTTDLATLAKSSLDDYLKNAPVDQIAQDRPLLKKLMGKRKPFGGAKQNVVEQLRKSYDSNFQFAYGEQKVTFNKRDTLEQAQFPWRRVVDALYIAYDTLFSNGIDVKEGGHGSYRLETNEKVQLTNLLDENLTALREGFYQSLDLHMHRDGTSSADAFVGLDGLIALDPTTGTLGGLDRSKMTWWRNYADLTLAKATMVDQMEKAWRECIRHGGRPDFILAGSDFLDAYRSCITITQNADAGKIKRVDASTGDGINTGLYFKGVEIVWDPTFDDLDATDAPATKWAKRCYFINTKTLQWKDDGYDIVTPVRPHDTLCLYEMVNLRCVLTLNRANANAVLALA
jgi:hypothetical protein